MKLHREGTKLIWIDPNVIWYDLEQVEWLLPQLYRMREGKYPLEPGGGYVDIQQRISSHAPFEIICQVAAELDIRLAHTGYDRYLLEDSYCKGMDDEDIAHKVGKDVWEVRKRILSAKKYIASGNVPRWITTPRRKGISYEHWVRRGRR
jgi:hypothetical protein